ncbi:MAG: hypothetical protein JWO03_3369 [Bacteroidetes bacterium]|nr:hypothetical protein [Bacteroidota bacterium]
MSVYFSFKTIPIKGDFSGYRNLFTLHRLVDPIGKMRSVIFIHILSFILLSSCQSGASSSNPAKEVVTVPLPEHDSITSPLVLAGHSDAGQRGFKSIITNRLKAKLIPSNGRRRELGITKIDGIFGVTHFFLDHDLTTGYVHRYTQNFFNKLTPDDFVMRFDRETPGSDVGIISYIRRGEMKTTDTLGRNIAFFRQWRLSDIDYREGNGIIEMYMMPSVFAAGSVSPQIRKGRTNPSGPQLTIWSQYDHTGYIPLDKFSKLDQRNGGTVVIIWEDITSHQILFQDVHGSLSDIMQAAISISKQYHADPVIAISDAGPMANKFLADDKHILDCTPFPLSGMDYAGAGFGYIP